jgi:hypothetical protein
MSISSRPIGVEANATPCSTVTGPGAAAATIIVATKIIGRSRIGFVRKSIAPDANHVNVNAK